MNTYAMSCLEEVETENPTCPGISAGSSSPWSEIPQPTKNSRVAGGIAALPSQSLTDQIEWRCPLSPFREPTTWPLARIGPSY